MLILFLGGTCGAGPTKRADLVEFVLTFQTSNFSGCQAFAIPRSVVNASFNLSDSLIFRSGGIHGRSLSGQGAGAVSSMGYLE